jgi:hypothetical protein
LASFNKENVHYALIGGYAIGLWGVARGTVDMDFLVLREDMDKVDRIMDSLGYELRFRSDNVSQFISSLAVFGEIDFLHAFRVHSRRMLERAVKKTIFREDLSVRVLMPEDLIGLKVQAIANNRDREPLDLYDIGEIMRLHGGSMDWKLVEEYFDIFEMRDLLVQLKEKFHVAD